MGEMWERRSTMTASTRGRRAGRRGAAVAVDRPPGELLADRAYAEPRDRMVTLRIAPGAPIDEDVIGQELQIGRTPVREAIKRLSLENVVTAAQADAVPGPRRLPLGRAG